MESGGDENAFIKFNFHDAIHERNIRIVGYKDLVDKILIPYYKLRPPFACLVMHS